MVFLASSCNVPVKNENLVVTTNSWTAAFAKAAGAKNLLILAPYEMEHPSEYELRATDIPALTHAKVIIYAGYETMVKRIQSGMDIKKEALLKIDTDYSMETMEKSVMAIAKFLGTEKIAKQNLDSIRHVLTTGKMLLDKSGIKTKTVVVNFFQKSIVKEMGLNISGVFGPVPLEATDIDRIAKANSGIIIDNEHNPIGVPLQKIKSDAIYIQLLNFPGKHHTITLKDVIQYNIRQLCLTSEKI